VLARHAVDPSTAAYDFLRPTVASHDTLVSLSEVAAEHPFGTTRAPQKLGKIGGSRLLRTLPTKPEPTTGCRSLLLAPATRCRDARLGVPHRAAGSCPLTRPRGAVRSPAGASCSLPKTQTFRTSPGADVVGEVGHHRASLPRSRSSSS
jgi:hypothetical protein